MSDLCDGTLLTGSFNFKNNVYIQFWKKIMTLNFFVERKQESNSLFKNNLVVSNSLCISRSSDISIALKGEPTPDTISNLWYAWNRSEWTSINYLFWKWNIGHLKRCLHWGIANQPELRNRPFLAIPMEQQNILEDTTRDFSTSLLYANKSLDR